MKIDNMIIEILEDGTIKTTTDPISGANHQNAEACLGSMARLAGGETTRKSRSGLAHTHEHGHTHEHEGGGHDHHH